MFHELYVIHELFTISPFFDDELTEFTELKQVNIKLHKPLFFRFGQNSS